MVKMAVFSFIITSISAFYGYNASGGSLGVGRSATKAIVTSSVTILVANLVITQLMLN
jgi:phospholipid/cholesterol/gamma-HCH transport system permease protein